jgi:hypothetical protein
MENFYNLAITLCLLGSSAAGYAFGVLTNKKKTDDLEYKIKELLEDPNCYKKARDVYVSYRR